MGCTHKTQALTSHLHSAGMWSLESLASLARRHPVTRSVSILECALGLSVPDRVQVTSKHHAN